MHKYELAGALAECASELASGVAAAGASASELPKGRLSLVAMEAEEDDDE